MTITLASLLFSITLSVFGVKAQSPCTVQDRARINSSGVFVFNQALYAGRVEICHCSPDTSCYWNTVSAGSLTEPFSWKNSIVVCRELGYFDVQSPILQNTVGSTSQADESIDIYPFTFVCDGTESKLAECETEISTDTFTHSADAYITCGSTPIDRKVRITGSTDEDNGVVEIYTYMHNASGSWLTICPDYWDDHQADIICKSLGYRSGESQLFSRSNSFANTAIVETFTCGADVASSVSCSISLGQSCADISSLAGAVCHRDRQAEGSVRQYFLYANAMFSRVEVLYAGRWGTVCNTAWDIDSGRVACANLGSTRDLTQVPTASQFSPIAASSRPIWIRGYNCHGSESRLTDCSRPSFPVGFLTTSCSHSLDAGLYCEKAPHRLTGGEIAAIAISSTIFVVTVVTIIILHDKHKKGELQRWYRPRRARFLRWYHRQRQRLSQCCRCCRRSRRRTPQQLSQPVTTTQPTPTSTTPQQPPPPATTRPTSTPATAPVLQPLEPGLTPSAPPTYDDALREQHVPRPPPVYEDDVKLPYPEPMIGFEEIAYPPAGPQN